MLRFPAITERETKIASVLRPLGFDPLTREHAQVAARLLCVRWTHVHRLRRRSLASPPGHELGDTKEDGPKARHWLDRNVEVIVQTALDQWMPRQRHLTHSWLDLCKEIGQRCTGAHLPQPSRNTVAQRWALYRGEQHHCLPTPPGRPGWQRLTSRRDSRCKAPQDFVLDNAAKFKGPACGLHSIRHRLDVPARWRTTFSHPANCALARRKPGTG